MHTIFLGSLASTGSLRRQVRQLKGELALRNDRRRVSPGRRREILEEAGIFVLGSDGQEATTPGGAREPGPGETRDGSGGEREGTGSDDEGARGDCGENERRGWIGEPVSTLLARGNEGSGGGVFGPTNNERRGGPHQPLSPSAPPTRADPPAFHTVGQAQEFFLAFRELVWKAATAAAAGTSNGRGDCEGATDALLGAKKEEKGRPSAAAAARVAVQAAIESSAAALRGEAGGAQQGGYRRRRRRRGRRRPNLAHADGRNDWRVHEDREGVQNETGEAMPPTSTTPRSASNNGGVYAPALVAEAIWSDVVAVTPSDEGSCKLSCRGGGTLSSGVSRGSSEASSVGLVPKNNGGVLEGTVDDSMVGLFERFKLGGGKEVNSSLQVRYALCTLHMYRERGTAQWTLHYVPATSCRSPSRSTTGRG